MSRRRMLMVQPKEVSGKPINRIRTVAEEYNGSYRMYAVAEFPITSPMLQVWYRGSNVSIIEGGETQGDMFALTTDSAEFLGFQLDWGDMQTATKEDDTYIYVYDSETLLE